LRLRIRVGQANYFIVVAGADTLCDRQDCDHGDKPVVYAGIDEAENSDNQAGIVLCRHR
jgi:hypothetical protein